MRRLSSIAALVAPAVLAACGAPQRSDLTLDWTFDNGLNCAQAGAATIQVDVEGEVLTPNRFACQAAAGGAVNTGAYLGSYLLGTYNVTVSGLDSAGSAFYLGTRAITVKPGGTRESIDAVAGSATLRWTFGGKGCDAAGVKVVHASVDGYVLSDGTTQDLACSQRGIDGITIGPLAPGTHSIDLTGYVNGQIAYQLSGYQVSVALGRDTAGTPNLLAATPTTGTADVRWSFVTSVAGGMTCAEAFVDLVHVRFDPAPDGTGGTDAGTVACRTSGVDGMLFDGVPPGTHSFAITGIRHTSAGDVLVYDTRAPASGRFQAGLTTGPIEVVAEAAPPGKGGVALTFQFPPNAVCGGASSVSYTLTDPAGRSTQFTEPCTGAVNTRDFCWTGSSTSNCPGLQAGLWTLNATAGTTSAKNVYFGVANGAHGSLTVAFQ